jgi:uncharacterized protein
MILLFIHGGGKGAYQADQQLAAYLQNALKDCLVKCPQMPDEADPNYEKYKQKIDEEIRNIDAPFILAGHSLGSCFLLKYLSENPVNKNITAIFLIATPYWGGDGWQYEGFRLADDFSSKLPAVPTFFYHGTNDEVVPYHHLALYAQKVPGAHFRSITGKGHQLDNDLSTVVHDLEPLL